MHYGTTMYVTLRYLSLSPVRVYTQICRHVSGTSRGSCNLYESTAEGRQWSLRVYVGGDYGYSTPPSRTNGSKQEALSYKHIKITLQRVGAQC